MKKTPFKPKGPKETGKKMILSVQERYYFPTLLPSRGNVTELELKQALRKRISLTPQEIEDYEVRILSSGEVKANNQAASREFTFEPFELSFIIESVKMHNETRSLFEANLSLAKRFLNMKLKPTEPEDE